MDFETYAYNEIKKYLESLGYPGSTIFAEYSTNDSKIDAVVKDKSRTLLVIEIKGKSVVESISSDEIGYHPVTRRLQKAAIDLGAKYYLLSDGKLHIWLKTGENGRPEKTVAIQYANFNANTLSEAEFTKALLTHVAEYIRNFPITGDHLFDVSVVLYTKLNRDKNGTDIPQIDLKGIIGNHLFDDKHPSYSSQEILTSALERLEDTDLLENRIAVFEFIDDLFEKSRKEWNVPRWMAHFMVSLINKDVHAELLDMFSKNGILTSAAYLEGYHNVLSYYTHQKELYWIKIQQLLGNRQETEVKYEPGLLKGDVEVLPVGSMDVVLLAPPFNLKFTSDINSLLGKEGVKDGNVLFLEAALNAIKDEGKVVAIVPDGFLLSAQNEKARAYFQSTVEAIISLPEGAFKPYSGVKASIIILTKNDRRKSSKVFMALLEKIPEANFLYKEYDNSVEAILDNISSFRANEALVSTKNSFIIDQLDVKNFHISKYWLNKQTQFPVNLKSGFAAIPLKELVKTILRGSSLVKDVNGTIPYINPAAIRELQLKAEDLAYTTEARLPNGKLQRAVTNDVLVNMIGAYRGKAVLVSKEFDGMLFNRHVAVIKPNTDFIIPGYLAVVLNSQFVQDQFYDSTSGTVIPALNLVSFENIILPVPDLEEQKLIYGVYAQMLEELYSVTKRASVLEGEINQRLVNLGKGGEKL